MFTMVMPTPVSHIGNIFLFRTSAANLALMSERFISRFYPLSATSYLFSR